MLSYSDAYFTKQIISFLLSRIEIGQRMASKMKFEVEMVKPTSKFCAPELFLNELCSDVKIQCQGRTFPCHKCVLVVRRNILKHAL